MQNRRQVNAKLLRKSLVPGPRVLKNRNCVSLLSNQIFGRRTQHLESTWCSPLATLLQAEGLTTRISGMSPIVRFCFFYSEILAYHFQQFLSRCAETASGWSSAIDENRSAPNSSRLYFKACRALSRKAQGSYEPKIKPSPKSAGVVVVPLTLARRRCRSLSEQLMAQT